MENLSSAILFLFALFLVSPARSRVIPGDGARTTWFHVPSSIQKSLAVFPAYSQGERSLDGQKQRSHSSSAFSLPLHPRLSVRPTSERDYKSLTLARLERDSARVKSLQTRLDLAVNGISRSDLKPVGEEELQDEKLEGPIISGTSQGSGEYFSRVGIGNPPSEVYMVLDTGSDVNWLQCSPCADCYQQVDPIFDPANSSTYSPLTCDAKQCRSLQISECRNNTCLYEVSYGDGSYTVGDLATESVTFGGSASVNGVAIGCGHSNEGLFVGAAGLIGLGGGPLSFPSQINVSSFSYCLVDRDSDSSSTLEFDSVTPPDAVTAPLVRNAKLDTFYYVDLTGVSVAGKLIDMPPSLNLKDNGDGGVIVDSGTAVTRLQTDFYDSVRDEFVRGTGHLRGAGGVALFDTCFDLSNRTSVEVPTVSFHFSNGNKLQLPAENYLIPVDSSGTYCFAFAPSSSSLSIIGNVQQQGTRVSFDLARSLIGFSAHKC
ncbi:hypothetical protein DM860_002257 [Cuscuta australis]|uniref:Peptidase A1 domain-containing protein n=1 Tax=Cuscuta australis TaxID=267555 RepID=A0A328D1N0_9ASTE|nr:hypothetical protein DM860_002257 [Cuscuta australis]